MSKALLERLGVSAQHYTQGEHRVHSPIDGSQLGSVALESAAEVEQKISRADRAFQAWRAVPAPRRGELLRLLGEGGERTGLSAQLQNSNNGHRRA